ncbi:MAG: helix-turn-helix transcriptional regulator [Candidatus Marinimicrobia bacterium]|nr:helix-turn-helix transcriptional regulator [Candidatus Neomarinimicrobiota bacterium]
MKNEIRVWRAKRDITQAQLAQAVGLSRQTIHSIERRKYVPSVLSALKIAAFFEIRVEEIFYLERKEI